MLDAWFYEQAIDDDFDGVVFALVERAFVFHINQSAFHTVAREAVLDKLFPLFFELAFASPDNGGHDHDTVFRGQGHDPLDNLLSGLSGDWPPAFGAVRDADRGV